MSERAVAYRVVCAIAGRVLNPFADCGFSTGCNCRQQCAVYIDLFPERAA